MISGTPFDRGVPVFLVVGYLLGKFLDNRLLDLLVDLFSDAQSCGNQTDAACGLQADANSRENQIFLHIIHILSFLFVRVEVLTVIPGFVIILDGKGTRVLYYARE